MNTRPALALSVAMIVFVVVPWYGLQNHSHWDNVRWIPFVSPPVRVKDIVGNILLFAPFGACLAARSNGRGAGAWPVIALAMVLSVLAEWTQVYAHGRFPSTGDVFCNVAGAAAGAAAFRVRLRRNAEALFKWSESSSSSLR